MENEVDSTRISMLIVLVLSLLLITMDILELRLSYENLQIISKKVDKTVFDECFKFQIISQLVFTVFACLAAISAMLMSIGLLVNYRYFTNKLMDSYLHYNYIVFGPYLLSACLLSLIYFNNVVYTCEKDYKDKRLNFATMITILLCLIISFLVTITHSTYNIMFLWVQSISNRPNGNTFLGKVFWRFALSRNNQNYSRNVNTPSPLNNT